jgi:outer membrane biosynthesis protein TonB
LDWKLSEEPEQVLVVQEAPLPKELEQQLPPEFAPSFQEIENAKADPRTHLEAEYTNQQASQTPAERDSLAPNVTGQSPKGVYLRDSMASQGKEPSQPQPAGQPTASKPTRDAPAKEVTEAKPKQPPPKPDKGEEEKPAETAEASPKPPEPTEQKPQTYAENALPVLPPEAEKKLAAPASSQQPEMQPGKAPRPPPMALQQSRSKIEGSGPEGDPAFATMSTPEGRYRSRIYRAVGTRWHLSIDQYRSTLGLGEIVVSFFIRSNGVVENVEISRRTGSNTQLLETISMEAIIKAAPFEPFPEAMRKKYGLGYSEEFSFTIH